MKQILFLFTVLLIGTYTLYGQKIADEDPYLLWKTKAGYDGFIIHPNGNIIALRSGMTSILDGSTGEVIRILNTKSPIADISPDGKYLLIFTDSVTIIDYETEEVVKKLSVQGQFPNLRYFQDGNRIIYKNKKPLGTGLDSIIVVYDLIKDKYTYLDLKYSHTAIGFSPDGKYFATGGSGYEGKDWKGDYISYTYLTLWDAQTLKPIKELDKFEGNREVTSIKFSPDGKYVGFQVYFASLLIYKIEDTSLSKYYDENNVEYGVLFFCFLPNDLIGLSSGNSFKNQNFMIKNLLNDKEIFYRHEQSGLLDFNPIHNSFLVNSIRAYDFKKIITNVETTYKQIPIIIDYRQDTLILYGINSISNQITITISDISGRIISKLNIAVTNPELRIPLKLPNGTYLIHIQDGNKEYSSKFFVSE